MKIGKGTRGALLFLAFGLNAGSVSAEFRGTASVIDGDTIELHGERVRLHGIDAPESSQLCRAAGKGWRCGQQAALALSDHIGRRPVSCEERDRDRYGRIVAVCSLGYDKLNAWMVSEGWAMAYRQYSTDYVEEEEVARAEKIGIWRGEFVPPWEWRRGQRLADSQGDDRAPAGCTIKATSAAMGASITSPAANGISGQRSIPLKESSGSARRRKPERLVGAGLGSRAGPRRWS